MFPRHDTENRHGCWDDGGGGNRTRARFPRQCVGCPEQANAHVVLPSGRVAHLCDRCLARARSTCVYFARSGSRVKIGFSSDVARRIASLRQASPLPIELWHVEQGGRDLERQLHERFAASRVHGEWFEITDGLREYVAQRTLT